MCTRNVGEIFTAKPLFRVAANTIIIIQHYWSTTTRQFPYTIVVTSTFLPSMEVDLYKTKMLKVFGETQSVQRKCVTLVVFVFIGGTS